MSVSVPFSVSCHCEYYKWASHWQQLFTLWWPANIQWCIVLTHSMATTEPSPTAVFDKTATFVLTSLADHSTNTESPQTNKIDKEYDTNNSNVFLSVCWSTAGKSNSASAPHVLYGHCIYLDCIHPCKINAFLLLLFAVFFCHLSDDMASSAQSRTSRRIDILETTKCATIIPISNHPSLNTHCARQCPHHHIGPIFTLTFIWTHSHTVAHTHTHLH